MAQLPPKIPNPAPAWPDLKPDPDPSAADNQNPTWVDEFLDFSAARRMAHRRAVSDPADFVDGPMFDHPTNNVKMVDFDRFDGDQFISIFTDDVANAAHAPPSTNPSSPSDHNSINDDKQSSRPEPDPQHDQQQHRNPTNKNNDNEEVQSQCESFEAQPSNPISSSAERPIDPKRVKRILANRQSAQRSRVRKLHYITELERSVTTLQAEVSLLSPRVAFLDHQRFLLNVDNSALKQRIAALAQDKVFKDAHHEALRREIERLRQVYQQQNLRKMENAAASSPTSDVNVSNEMEQLLDV